MRLLLAGAYRFGTGQINKLIGLGYEVILVQDERVPLNFDVSNIDVVVCNSLFLYSDISLFKKLKVIQVTSSGLDRIPLEYARENKIIVLNAKGVYSIPMAEWVILKILEIYKKSKFFYKNQENQIWDKRRDLLELRGKTASIIGYGNVGCEVAKRLKAFDVNIVGVGRNSIQSNYVDESININELDVALKKSDIVILTLPLNSKTRHLINKKQLDNMKENAVLINVARGEIIDENELIRTLNDGKLLGVALDVFKEEPLGESPLWNFENVIITPHNSFVSENINTRLFDLIYKNMSKLIFDYNDKEGSL